jgi:drug/metabolite transporter (DMT)-like permease
MGILLGLLTAVAWGSSDFLARFAARRIGALRTSLYMQLSGFVLLTMFLPWIGGWGHLMDGSGWRPWAWGALAGVLNGAATLSLYRSFEIGKMAVVAPISAAYPALTVILSSLSGERLTIARIAGIACILLGVIVVAHGETPSDDNGDSSRAMRSDGPAQHDKIGAASRSVGAGIGWAFASGIGFGVLFWLLGTRIVPAVGFASTVWLLRLTSSVLTACVLLLLRQPITFSRDSDGRSPVSSWLFGMGILDTGAFVLNNRGLQLEQVSVVSVLASLYGAVTVILAAIFLREHLSRWQWLGIVAIFAGIALISR